MNKLRPRNRKTFWLRLLVLSLCTQTACVVSWWENLPRAYPKKFSDQAKYPEISYKLKVEIEPWDSAHYGQEDINKLSHTLGRVLEESRLFQPRPVQVISKENEKFHKEPSAKRKYFLDVLIKRFGFPPDDLTCITMAFCLYSVPDHGTVQYVYTFILYEKNNEKNSDENAGEISLREVYTAEWTYIFTLWVLPFLWTNALTLDENEAFARVTRNFLKSLTRKTQPPGP